MRVAKWPGVRLQPELGWFDSSRAFQLPSYGKLCSGVGPATGLENRVLLTGMGFASSTFRHSFLVFAPIAQLDQSTCLRSKGSHVRIVLGAPYFSLIAQLVERRTVNAVVAGSIPAWGARFSVIRQVVCRLLWEQVVGCSIHPSRTIFGRLTERPKVADCKSARNCTLVRIQQRPPIEW